MRYLVVLAVVFAAATATAAWLGERTWAIVLGGLTVLVVPEIVVLRIKRRHRL